MLSSHAQQRIFASSDMARSTVPASNGTREIKRSIDSDGDNWDGTLIRRIPHQPRIKCLRREHRKDHYATECQCSYTMSDRNDIAELHKCSKQRLHEDVNHRPAADPAHDMVQSRSIAQPA